MRCGLTYALSTLTPVPLGRCPPWCMWWVLVCMRGCDSFTFGLTYTAGPLSRTASQTVVVVASATPLTASLTPVVVNAEGEASTGKSLSGGSAGPLHARRFPVATCSCSVTGLTHTHTHTRTYAQTLHHNRLADLTSMPTGGFLEVSVVVTGATITSVAWAATGALTALPAQAALINGGRTVSIPGSAMNLPAGYGVRWWWW